MRASDFRGLPPSPPDIAAWEDLLVRIELGPRAIRVAIDTAETGTLGSATDPDGWSVAAHLHHLAAREAVAGEWLTAMREGEPLPLAEEPVAQTAAAQAPAAGNGVDGVRGSADPGDSVADALRLYAGRRARTFAMVQRRGLDVWEWRAEHPEVGPVSPYQLLCYLATHDGRHLARIRASLRESC